MGVSGAGKTLVGRTLARDLGWPFIDADDLHPQSNIAKMAAGIPLEPADRMAWLDAIRAALLKVDRANGDAVLACSALRAGFRDALRAGIRDVRFVHLVADRALIRARVASRTDHFMPVSLVDSQFETLEMPGDAIEIDASQPPEAIAQAIAEAVRRD